MVKDKRKNREPVTIAVLGGGFAKKGIPPEGIELSKDSKMRVRAAGYRLKKEGAGKLILSGGQTRGSSMPSEAEFMSKYLLSIFPELKATLALESRSIDTSENVKYLIPLFDDDETVEVVTSAYHVKRAERLFKAYGRAVSVLSAESILAEKEPEEIEKFLSSNHYAKRQRTESLLNAFLVFDRRQVLLRQLAKMIRR